MSGEKGCGGEAVQWVQLRRERVGRRQRGRESKNRNIIQKGSKVEQKEREKGRVFMIKACFVLRRGGGFANTQEVSNREVIDRWQRHATYPVSAKAGTHR